MTTDASPISTCTIDIRVRYTECDPMGVAHHTAYPVWFEIGRTELCRAGGLAYADLEARGVFLAVARIGVQYRSPARYDDVLQLETALTRATRVKLQHTYRLTREGLLLTTGETTLACLDAEGRLQPLPDDVAAVISGG